jgi:hypothetical protein
MSAMKWTYKENVVGTALKDIGGIKKGGSIPVQVYEWWTIFNYNTILLR